MVEEDAASETAAAAAAAAAAALAAAAAAAAAATKAAAANAAARSAVTESSAAAGGGGAVRKRRRISGFLDQPVGELVGEQPKCVAEQHQEMPARSRFTAVELVQLRSFDRNCTVSAMPTGFHDPNEAIIRNPHLSLSFCVLRYEY